MDISGSNDWKIILSIWRGVNMMKHLKGINMVQNSNQEDIKMIEAVLQE